MYIPKHYREEDRRRIVEFMQEHGFAALVASDGERPVASHLLMEVIDENDALLINGHMSRANPLWKLLRPGHDVLVIFQGPHAYISPTWYNHLNVPTWNYQGVHAYGRPRLLSDGPEYRAMLSRLIARYEKGSSYRLENLPEDYVAKNMAGTVGFQIEVTRLEAGFKLSQNRDDEDYRNIILELEARGDDLSNGVAAAMRRGRRLDETPSSG